MFAAGDLQCFDDAANAISGSHDLAVLKYPVQLMFW